MKLFTLTLSLVLVQAAPPPKAIIEGTVSQSGSGIPLAGVHVILAKITPPAAAGTPAAPAALPQAPPLASPPPALPPGAIQGGAAAPAGASISSFIIGNAAGPQVPANSAGLPSATTDSQGRYILKDLEPGSYRVTFAMNGYVKQDYGQRSFTGQGTALVLSAGQNLKDINMAMTQTGNVSGRIRDTYGMPAAGVPVQLIRATYNASGQKGFQSVESGRTDDRGEYRLFWVSPGRYFLNAGTSPGPSNRPAALGGTGAIPNQVPGESFVYSYFPGVTNVSQAVGIDVGAGSELSGIDFAIAQQKLLNIRGRVVDTRTGQAPASASITVSYQVLDGGGSFSNANTYNAATGTFELTNLVPGPYTITASVQEPISGAVNTPGQATRAASSVVMPVEVFNGDLENVVLNLSPASPLSGHVVASAAQPPSLAAIRVQLRPSTNGILTSSIGLNGVQVPATNADGSFRVESVPSGEYRVGVVGMPQDFYVKDIQFQQNDVLNKPLEISGRDSGTLEIEIRNGAVQIDGTVLDAKSSPATGVTVVLVPDQHRDRTELFKNATTDSTGRYTLRGVAPGDYKLFAWNSVEQFSWFDPDVIRPVESKGKAIHVLESSNQTVELRAITE